MSALYKRFTLFFIVVVILGSCNNLKHEKPVKLEGSAFGTSFHITYFNADQNDYSKSIDSLFSLVNTSLSTYISNSDISKINSGDSTIIVDHFFTEVFKKSSAIYKDTDGVFDPTIGILVNAWGFGPEKSTKGLDSIKIKHLLSLVGFNKVKLLKGKVVKDNDSMYFDFNAIAKGYAVDVAGRFLEMKNISNYLVEIGGELRSKGMNKSKNAFWKVGIEHPNYDGTRSFEKIIELNNQSMATSGNYRKFKIDSITGRKYAHIINSKTGYPAQSDLLSVSIIAENDCADVDAYATAVMAMSLNKAQNFLESKKQFKGFIIYSDDSGAVKTFATSNF
ncbi:FAD:protein FMN transferase [Aureibaculum sp. A20]|uniref:FAD:protein FMN transferase n=1 Tax=Aureibaculum flavum TaxID=2795986 RepID=A0ABS0WSQ3_9FLAO|nr:FAD:protein FMN transferase [Aureibaculum flavum]MBJ2174903.1 FAD:protein FMN transferase [Aureibaculum flavum]